MRMEYDSDFHVLSKQEKDEITAHNRKGTNVFMINKFEIFLGVRSSFAWKIIFFLIPQNLKGAELIRIYITSNTWKFETS